MASVVKRQQELAFVQSNATATNAVGITTTNVPEMSISLTFTEPTEIDLEVGGTIQLMAGATAVGGLDIHDGASVLVYAKHTFDTLLDFDPLHARRRLTVPAGTITFTVRLRNETAATTLTAAAVSDYRSWARISRIIPESIN